METRAPVDAWRAKATMIEVVKVHRWYLIVLGVALAVGVVVVIPRLGASTPAVNWRANHARAVAAFAHLKVPAGYHAVPGTTAGCIQHVPCYYVAKPSTAISKAALSAVLRTTGAAYSYGTCIAFSPSQRSCFVGAVLDGLNVSALSRPAPCSRRERARRRLRAGQRCVDGSLVLIEPPTIP